MSREVLLKNVAQLVELQLKPHVQAIDREGFYPESFLRELGSLGGFASLATKQEGGSGYGLATQIDVLREISKVCGSTAFSAWCQSACVWYLHKTPNQAVKQKYLDNIANGRILAGTGMSNTVKHLAGIEKHLLQAKTTEGGYIVNGMLPWVSNLGESHVWANTAQIGTKFVMFMTGGQREGVTLVDCPEFSGLEGTRTFAIQFKDVFVPHEDVIADPDQFEDYIKSIKAGFILLQIGIGAGIIEDSLLQIKISNANSRTNHFLDHGFNDLNRRYASLLGQTGKLAYDIWNDEASLLETLQTRASASELCLDATQSAALHTGASGYLMSSPVQRRLREAMFVAIVTPALKHLRKEISELEFMAGYDYAI